MADQDAERWAAVEEATEALLEGAVEEALERLKAVIESDPQNHYAFHYLGTAMFEVGRWDAARDAYRLAVKLAPTYLGARVGLSQALRKAGDPREAFAVADETLRSFPDDGDALYAAALSLAALGRKRRALEVIQRFLATKPEVEVQLEAKGLVDMLNQAREGDPVTLDE